MEALFHHRRTAPWLGLLLLLLGAEGARAESGHAAVELGAGFARGRGEPQLSIQGAALAPLFGGPRDQPVQLTARLEFSYQRFHVPNIQFVDTFVLASLQADVINLEELALLAPDTIRPFFYAGLGLERLSPSYITQMRSDSGPVFTLGGGVKFFVHKDFYVVPTATYLHGFDEVKGNTFRATGALGYRF